MHPFHTPVAAPKFAAIASVPVAGTSSAELPAVPATELAAPATELAARLLGETAHDIKGPLMGIREMIRGMSEGDLGPVTEIQSAALADCVDQCESIFALVDNMLHLDRLTSGLPATRRQWIAPRTIPESVQPVIAPLARGRSIALRWDGFDGSHPPVYADPALLRRLLVNLVGNSVIISPERSVVRVSLRESAVVGASRVVVTDSGPGMNREDIQRLAARGVSAGGSSGLGLAICRALASLHFSHLSVASDPGLGTQVGIELAAGGPASVASALVRWRSQFFCHASGADEQLGAASAPGGGGVAFRIDPPSDSSHLPLANDAARRSVAQDLARAARGGSVSLSFDGSPPRCRESVCVVHLRLHASATAQEADAVDRMVQHDQRLHELVYRTDARRWVLLWDIPSEEAARRTADLDRRLGGCVAGAGIQWSEPAVLGMRSRRERAMLGDLLVRDTLHAASRRPLMDDRQGRRLLREPAAGDAVSARRLEEELRRLGSRLRRQSTALQRQATALGAIAASD